MSDGAVLRKAADENMSHIFNSAISPILMLCCIFSKGNSLRVLEIPSVRFAHFMIAAGDRCCLPLFANIFKRLFNFLSPSFPSYALKVVTYVIQDNCISLSHCLFHLLKSFYNKTV